MPTIENNKDDQFSLEDTNTSGFHFDTPPGVSLESEIQPCGINGNSTHRTGSEEPSSLDSKSLEVSSDLLSETTTSSEYKVPSPLNIDIGDHRKSYRYISNHRAKMQWSPHHIAAKSGNLQLYQHIAEKTTE